MVSSVGSTSNSTPVVTEATDPLAKLSQDYTTFLKMLTTQLQNQDPLSPMDSSQFTQQLVAFSGVEQQIAANDKLKELLNLQKTSGTGALLGYIGKEVESNGTELAVKQGQEPRFSYTLADRADEVSVEIKNAKGDVVRKDSLSGTVGRHEITWDGLDDDGKAVPTGSYTLNITAKKNDDSAVKFTSTTYSIVDGVESSSSGAVLSMGPLRLSVDKVLSIHAVPQAPAQANAA